MFNKFWNLDEIDGSLVYPGVGNGSPLWYSCLENSMDKGAWWATVQGIAKSWTPLSDYHFCFYTFVKCKLLAVNQGKI